jgi:amino acid transporter
LGAYTIVGFESASNLAEETHEPRKVVPKAMIRAVFLSGIVGFAFLIALSYAIKSLPAASASSAPVAFIIKNVLGGVVQKFFLVFVCISIFACGLVIMVTNSRLIWAMARDRRLPGHQLWSKVPRSTGGPSWATGLAAVIGIGIILVLQNNSNALVQLFTASTIMPALLYAATVILYVSRAHRVKTEEGHFKLGRWETPVITGALIWLAYELVVLIGPKEFRTAQYYVLGSLAVGLVVYLGQLLLEPAALRANSDSGSNAALK